MRCIFLLFSFPPAAPRAATDAKHRFPKAKPLGAGRFAACTARRRRGSTKSDRGKKGGREAVQNKYTRERRMKMGMGSDVEAPREGRCKNVYKKQTAYSVFLDTEYHGLFFDAI